MEAATTTDAGRAAPPPRLREHLRVRARAGADREVRLHEPDAGSAPGEDHPQHGCRRGQAGDAGARGGGEQLATIAGQRPSVRRARQVDRELQAPRGDAGRRLGDAARGADVGVPRPPDHDRDPAHPRLPRAQLRAPSTGAATTRSGVREQLIFPEIDYDSIDEVRGLDITITTSAPTDEEAFELLLGLGMPFAAEGRPGAVDTAAEEEEERRKEEARLRAEAEQAALEQLRGREPRGLREARAPRGRRRGGRGGRRRCRRRGGRRRRLRTGRTGWLRPRSGCVSGASRSTRPAATTAAGAAGARVPTTASSASAGSACARPPTRATCPG